MGWPILTAASLRDLVVRDVGLSALTQRRSLLKRMLEGCASGGEASRVSGLPFNGGENGVLVNRSELDNANSGIKEFGTSVGTRKKEVIRRTQLRLHTIVLYCV
jgi:hypothetical protein